MEESIQRICDCFGEALTEAVNSFRDDLCEIRVRADKPIVLSVLNEPYFLGKSGCLTKDIKKSVFVSHAELKSVFSCLCSYSVYKHMESITDGFITLAGGHRVGVCGTASIRDGRVQAVSEITSLNVRLAKSFVGCADSLLKSTDPKKGILICGVPSSGKTTILRDMARTLSLIQLKKVSVIDERLEIAASYHGQAGFDVGLADVYSGYPKSKAMTLAVRTMSPDYIICDELTGDDPEPIKNALNCGVSVIATAHCADKQAIKRNPSVFSLVETGAFGQIIFLESRLPPTIAEIYTAEEVLS